MKRDTVLERDRVWEYVHACVHVCTHMWTCVHVCVCVLAFRRDKDAIHPICPLAFCWEEAGTCRLLFGVSELKRGTLGRQAGDVTPL